MMMNTKSASSTSLLLSFQRDKLAIDTLLRYLHKYQLPGQSCPVQKIKWDREGIVENTTIRGQTL
ncbi:hypothetical protein FRX31_020634 [Thalictrum thalictroides]|uniref:Uncharacterized protein n=1 Tax=Thalictrum thalictroides TaxID=46969 RepID=A0A7J6VXB5_THATH|nr:hypothetical protein FRX31_020634 [Thalictrum thalictroides]